jgi:hypothetical protein
LLFRQALPLREEGWDLHMGALLDELERHFSETHRSATAGAGGRSEDMTIPEAFRAAASRFYGAPIDERMAAAEEIAGLGGLFPLEEVLEVRSIAGSRRARRCDDRTRGPPPNVRATSR